MPFYENVFIARQDISPAQAEALADTFTGIVKERGGDVTKREYWGLRSLTYRIKKNRKGHYILLNVDAPPAAIHEMERNMRLNEDVLRFLTVRVEELEAGPSMMMQRREERGDRDRDRDRGPRRRDFEGGDGDRTPRDGERAERAPGGEA
jgi:small subunit ribosomal protein S6